MTIKEYIAELDRQASTGVAREHTYRPALQNLLASLLPNLTVSNEPARQACGAPDYILQRKETNVPVAFIEAKDLDDNDLGGRKRNKEQFDRYKHSLDNLIFTDYLDFWLYEKGEFVDSIRIGEIKGEKIVALPDNFEKFEQLVAHFGDAQPQKITSSSKLAEIMAGKARLLAAVIEKTIEESGEESTLTAQMEAFKEVLIHTITPKEFADVYAQTIAYGMFAARLHDESPDTFSRQEAATLIPKTNPFLRQLFQYIAGYDLDERISWIVDDLAESFRVTDIKAVMQGFGKRTQQTDPMIHFYEDFLSAYDPALRKSRGVWYTPQSVVNFIVRGVDEILQTEFGLPMGLADTSKTKMKVPNQKTKKKEADHYEIDVHRVQILDPATGTGTFLAEAVSQIYEKFRGQGGMWQGYVEEHLIPRLNGFELLMASYTMAHLKLDLLLESTGYKHIKNDRLRVFLTNSLEEYSSEANKLGLYKWLADEGNEADKIKRDTPVMVVMGNPPYSGESNNKGTWILKLMEDYKREPDTSMKLQERNSKMINDDYCKFIRLGQYFVDKNTEGVLAYINNHSFIDNITFRGMRWNLMNSFDKIFIIDLHGNSKKKEACPDGSKDENVFDIQQGVSINIFVKTGKKRSGELAEVYHYDLFGKRQSKYDFLLEKSISTVPYTLLTPSKPDYFFVPKDYSSKEEYVKGFLLTDLMPLNASGIKTHNDELNIFYDERNAEFLKTKFKTNEESILRDEFKTKDSRDWKLSFAIDDLKKHNSHLVKIAYRPFDCRYTNYTGNSKGIMSYPRSEVMRHFLAGENVGLLTTRQLSTFEFQHIFVSRQISDMCSISSQTKETGYVFPLYLYPEQADLLGSTRTPNLNAEIIKKFAESVGLEFEAEKNHTDTVTHFAPIDLLDYIYAVLHSPAYREKYKEFLKIDFPRVPYPTGDTAEERAENFRRLATLGGELRKLHLMEHPALSKLVTTYPIAGSNTVEKPRFELSDDGTTGKVWINSEQHFANVPTPAYNFYIGGYQPAQKWLKDRAGQTLTFDDIMHYQRVIVALAMTEELMQKIDIDSKKC